MYESRPEFGTKQTVQHHQFYARMWAALSILLCLTVVGLPLGMITLYGWVYHNARY